MTIALILSDLWGVGGGGAFKARSPQAQTE